MRWCTPPEDWQRDVRDQEQGQPQAQRVDRIDDDALGRAAHRCSQGADGLTPRYNARVGENCSRGLRGAAPVRGRSNHEPAEEWLHIRHGVGAEGQPAPAAVLDRVREKACRAEDGDVVRQRRSRDAELRREIAQGAWAGGERPQGPEPERESSPDDGATWVIRWEIDYRRAG